MVLEVYYVAHTKYTRVSVQKNEMVSGKKIAFMDFDGTITKKDSLLEFIKFQKGKLAFYTGFLLNLHWLVGYLLKLVPSDRAKQKVLNYFFAGLEQNLFQEKCDFFAQNI